MSDELNLNPEQARAAEAIAGLSRSEPPVGLAQRTLNRLAEVKPIKRAVWFLRPITNPVARVAAAALIVFTLSPMTDLNWADSLGQRIEQSVGSRVADGFESFVDGILVYQRPGNYKQSDLDALMGVNRGNSVRRPKTQRPPTTPQA